MTADFHIPNPQADAAAAHARWHAVEDDDRPTRSDLYDEPDPTPPPAAPDGTCGVCGGAGETYHNASRDPALETYQECWWCNGAGTDPRGGSDE